MWPKLWQTTVKASSNDSPPLTANAAPRRCGLPSVAARPLMPKALSDGIMQAEATE